MQAYARTTHLKESFTYYKRWGRKHKEKIKLADAILVVNVNGYIGNSTKSEIEFAKSLNKEILYYTDFIKR